MREDESNWFSRWEEQLPSPDELMPLSQTLITPDLALAFDIRNPNNNNNNNNNNSNNNLFISNNSNNNSNNHHHHHHHHHSSQTPPTPPPPPPPPPLPNNSSSVGGPPIQPNNSSEFDNSGDLGSGAAGDEPARTLKRPRLVWTPQLHKRFVDAVAHLGIKNAVPKTIMQLMSVDGLTRENVASHLQKYRLYLKRMQGLSSGGGGGGNGGLASADPATDHLFASSPVPPHFLHPGRSNSDHFLPFVPVTALQHHHHQQQMAAAAAAVAHPQLQQQYHQHRQVGHFGSPPTGQFEHPFLTRQSQQQQQPPVHRMVAPLHNSVPAAFGEDLESGTPTGGRKVLTLFPTGDD